MTFWTQQHLDGQEIFKSEDAVLKQFVFEQVLNLVSGTGTAGFKGNGTDAVTNLPLAEVLFYIKSSDKTTISGPDGKFSLTGLAAGDYEITASKEGYQDKKFTQTVKTGTVSNLDIGLPPL